ETDEAFYDKTLRRVSSRHEIHFRDLVLLSETSDKVSPEAAAGLLAREVIRGNCVLTHWDNAVEQWITRVNRLREWMTELGLPTLDDADKLALIEQICHGATTYKEIKERPVWPVVKGWLSDAQQQLVEKFTPERI